MTYLPWIIVCGLLLIISSLLYHIGNLYRKVDEVERWRNLAMQYNSGLHDMTAQRDALLELKMFNELKAMRPDFDLTCECGYYVCSECGHPAYPMEVDEDGGRCPECGEGEMFKHTSTRKEEN